MSAASVTTLLDSLGDMVKAYVEASSKQRLIARWEKELAAPGASLRLRYSVFKHANGCFAFTGDDPVSGEGVKMFDGFDGAAEGSILGFWPLTLFLR